VAKKPSHCLAEEGSNSLRFALIEKKEPQILRVSRIKTSKIRDIRVIRGENSPHCLADEGSNSLRFSNTETKEPQLQKQSSKAFDFEITVFKFYKLDLRVSNELSYFLLNLLFAFRY